MSGSSGGMDRRSPPRLKQLFVCLLVSTTIICLHGNLIPDGHHPHCVNDYLSTISCSLNIRTSENHPDSNSSYQLVFKKISKRQERFECNLTKTTKDYSCFVRINDPKSDETFTDTDSFEICLCYRQNDEPKNCKQLVGKYRPVKYIKPNAPRDLNVSHNSSQHHFTWISTYEKYEEYTSLVDNLQFQLHYYKGGDKGQFINTNLLKYSADDEKFVPDTKYTARVQSRPNQVMYKGEWSHWSSEVYWRTEPAVDVVPSKTFVSGLVKVLIPLCVMVPVVLLFCYAPLHKWRKSAFIPTPAPYFHTLFSDYQGDFKSWVVTQENTADMLKAEETLQIDTFTKCEVVEEEEEVPLHFHHHFTEGSVYCNIFDPGCVASLLGVPYAVSTMAPPSPPGSFHQSLTLSLQPGSPAEGDSGCWLEKDPPWYCNEYCTLSTFQQSGPVTAEHHKSPATKSCPAGLIRTEATEA